MKMVTAAAKPMARRLNIVRLGWRHRLRQAMATII
jgi:hypothetical protein